MRALLVEDDKALGKFLKKGLELEGHSVEWVADGEAGLAYALAEQPDLIVLDLSLPRLDGMEVLEELQRHGMDAALMVLTGRSELDVRVKCLDLGADDCLLKPFSLSELTARCRAMMRRRLRSADPILQHGEVRMNRMERRVMRGQHVIELTVKEFALLEYLLQHRGNCVSRSELLREAWHMTEDGGTNLVDVYINYLRRKLRGADGRRDEIIETVRGSGYRMGALDRKATSAAEGVVAGVVVCA